MPKSDDVIEQLRERRLKDAPSTVSDLIGKGAENIPFAGVAIQYFREKATDERQSFFDNAVLDILKTHDVSIDEIRHKLESSNVLSVVATAVEEIFWGASEKKVQRFAMVVGDTIAFAKTEQQFERCDSIYSRSRRVIGR